MREGWQTAKLGDVCMIRPPKKEAKEKLSNSDMVSFVPMNDLNVLSKGLTLKESKPLNKVSGSYTYFADGDVLLAKITPCFENGKVGIASDLVNGIGFGSSEFIVFRSKGDILPDYLFHYLSQASFREEGKRVMSGAVGHKRVPKEFIEEYQLPLPPLPEQERIVSILDKAFEGIDKAIAQTEQNLASARELFESYLNKVLPRNDLSWFNTTLGDSCEFFNGKAHEKCIDESGDFVVVNSKFISTDGKVIKRTHNQMFPLLKDDVVMVMSDVPKGKALAKCYLIKVGNLYSLNQRICCIRSTRFIPDYLRIQLSRHPFLLAFDNKGSQANLRKQDILSCPLYLPSIDEQNGTLKRLISFQEVANKLEALYIQKLNDLKELKQSLLQQAFAGELTKEDAA